MGRRGRSNLVFAAISAMLISACGATDEVVTTVTALTTVGARPLAAVDLSTPPATAVVGSSGAISVEGTSAYGRAQATSPAAARTAKRGTFTFTFAGDVHFAGRTLTRLQHDPATVFGVAASALSEADVTMVNLETAITQGGDQQNKSFTFRAPPSALTALREAGIDVATEANNHGADYGKTGLRDTLAAISASRFPVIGIGADAAHADAPFTRTVNGVRIAVFAASQVQDETLQNWSAGPDSAGIANAWSPHLIAAVKAAKASGAVVIVYVHWGTEYTTCPNPDQERLADALASAGAAAVVGTHAHLLQGAGWRKDGVYVAYGLSNYLWWRSFGNEQDDAGVLTLTFDAGRVRGAAFAPAHLDSTGVPVPAAGKTLERIRAEWARDRECAGLAATPPRPPTR